MALLSVIVPCYNEQETVSTFLTKSKKLNPKWLVTPILNIFS